MKKEFLKPENVYLIWELLSEQPIINNQQNQVKEEISNYVVNEINNFYNEISKMGSNFSLIDLNKEFIKFIVLYVKHNYPNKISRIKIHDEPITNKEIQERRELEFNTKFNELKNDFTNTVKQNKPDIPQFEDIIDNNDISISNSNIEDRLKEMTIMRKYDLQEIESNLNLETDKKNVTFGNEDNETSQVQDFFNNIDTYEETNYNSDQKYNSVDNSVEKDLQNQMNEIQEKILIIESKLDRILDKILDKI